MTPYAELGAATNFSFLRGASHPDEMVAAAKALGLAAIGVADRNSLAGVVRAHAAAKELGQRLLVGARLVTQEGPELLCFPEDRAAYGRLSALLTEGKRRAPKGECFLSLADVEGAAEGQCLVLLPPAGLALGPDADFEATLQLVERVDYASAYSFKYSPRPGTPAAGTDLQIDEAVKSDRLETLQQLLNAQQLAFNVASVGAVQPVLVERKGQKEGQLVGRGPYMQAVHFSGPDRLVGAIADVRIEQGFANSLSGTVVTGEWAGASGPPTLTSDHERAIA